MKWEVRTMRSGTSYFDLTIYKKTVARFWPLWAAYFALWFIIMPLGGMMYLRMDAYNGIEYGSYMENFAKGMVAGRAQTALPIAAVFGVLAAMAVFSHLYNARSANLFGSLPLRREGLFLSHYAAGLSYLIVPNLAVFLLTLIVEAAGGCVNMQVLLYWLAVSCGGCFLFYSMAVFCAMFTGHILALPIFYGVLNVFAAGVVGLVELVLDGFYYGFAGFGDWVHDVVKWLTPVWKLQSAVSCYWDSGRDVLITYGLGEVGIYVLAALALTAGAFLLYRARRLESAGDVVSVKCMRPVFKYGVALCVGMVFGVGTTVFLSGEEATLMVCILVWGVIGYFAAQMLLDKSFRVLKKWKGAAAVAGVFAALFLVVGFDLTGFETRVPDAADVQSVHVSRLSVVNFADDGDILRLAVDDPDQVALMTALHRAAIDQREQRTADTNLSSSVTLRYTLNNGSTLSREYYVYFYPSEVDQEGSAAWALERLYHDADLCWEVYGFDELEKAIAEGGRLDIATLNCYDKEGDWEWSAVGHVVGYGEDARALLNAVEQDVRAGRLGVRTLVGAEDYYYRNPRDSLSFRVVDPGTMDTQYQLEIALQGTASDTLAELERLTPVMRSETGRAEVEAALQKLTG